MFKHESLFRSSLVNHQRFRGLRHHGLVCTLALLLLPQLAHATEVWSGYDFPFTKVGFSDWTLEANQDRITDDTWITRQDTMGWFNIKTEAAFNFFISPANTEWAYDLLGNGNAGQLMAATNFANLTFEIWRDAINFNPPGVIGLPGVLHLISEDIYIEIMVTEWGTGGPTAAGGSFSYLRAQAPIPEPSTGLLMTLGLIILIIRRKASFSRTS